MEKLLVKLGKADVVEQGVEVVVNGFEFAPENRLAVSSGSLQAPKAVVAENGTGVFTLTPSWEKVANADLPSTSSSLKQPTVSRCVP